MKIVSLSVLILMLLSVFASAQVITEIQQVHGVLETIEPICKDCPKSSRSDKVGSGNSMHIPEDCVRVLKNEGSPSVYSPFWHRNIEVWAQGEYCPTSNKLAEETLEQYWLHDANYFRVDEIEKALNFWKNGFVRVLPEASAYDVYSANRDARMVRDLKAARRARD